MGVSKTKSCEAQPALILPPDCTVRTIAAITADVRERLAAGQGVVLDGSSVESADITFVQLMVSAQRSFAACSLPFALEGIPSPVSSAFSRAGIAMPASTSSLVSGAH